MDTRKEFFKRRNPEQFSDSKKSVSCELTEEFFDFYLDTLTSKNKEKEFETFCKKLLEITVCPNLIPQTGPTGGGDSKVDSETFPVSDDISDRWFSAEAKKASSERWAFAFSAKKAWKPKVKSDVQKIFDVNNTENRGYEKVFFASNQLISDKKRAEIEDELRAKFGFDIRILDRNWLIDNTFKGNMRIAVDSFNMPDKYLDEIIKGANDYRKEEELKEVEDRMKDQTTTKQDIIKLSKESLILNRELEVDYDSILGIIERNIRLTNKYGSTIDKDNAIYDACWTLYWWYDDPEKYYAYYKEYEAATVNQNNVEYIKNLSNLWMNLFSLSMENEGLCEISEHNSIIVSEHKKYIDDITKPNASLEAKANYQNVRLLLGEDIDDVVNEMIIILNSSKGMVNFDYEIIAKIVLDTPTYKEATNYNDLCNSIIAELGERKNDITVASLLISQGDLSIAKPYIALKYYGRALNKLISYDSKYELEITLMKLAICYEEVGLHWAARSFAMYALCLIYEDFYKFGTLNESAKTALRFLRNVELKLGRIINSVELFKLECMTMQYLNIELDSKDIDKYNYILGIQALRTDFELLDDICGIPDYLNKAGLDLAEAAMKYEFGYYDEEIMKQIGNDQKAFDDFISKWFNQTVNMGFIGMPNYNIEKNEICLSSKISGCVINIRTQNKTYLVEFCIAIISLIESFFATSIINNLFSQMHRINIQIVEDCKSKTFNPKIVMDEDNKLHKIFVQPYSINEIQNVQITMHEFNFELLVLFTSLMFSNMAGYEKLEDMIKDEDALGRSMTFANGFININETFGQDMFTYETVTSNCENIKRIRSEKSLATSTIDNEKQSSNDEISSMKISYDSDAVSNVFDETSQDDMSIDTIINVPLWNKAGWKGTATGAFYNESNILVPFIALMFSSKVGYKIYEEWIKNEENDNAVERLKIGIIKGIDKDNPYWYRVVIGTEAFDDFISDNGNNSKPIIIGNIVRFHTMEPNSDINIKRFEAFLKNSESFVTYPCEMDNYNEIPKKEFMIKKPIKDIKIINAWELKETDGLLLFGIKHDDKPIIPKGFEDSYILKHLDYLEENKSNQ